MRLQRELLDGKILKRYKRFLADIELENGDVITCHVANTGSMESCWGPNWPVVLSKSDNPKRKLPYTLELTHNSLTYIGVNTQNPNRLVEEGLNLGLFKEFKDYPYIKREAKVLDSKLDFLISKIPFEKSPSKEDLCYIEVKNVTLKGNNGLALFPDSKSTRGQKHLIDLAELKKQGLRTAMLYIVQREDVDRFSPAKEIDPKYAELLEKAHKENVEIYCYQCKLLKNEIYLDKALPVIFQ